jgi:hypothetical protein
LKKVILAYQNKWNNEFVPNGIILEGEALPGEDIRQFIDRKMGQMDTIFQNQFNNTYFNQLLDDQNIEYEEMHIEDALAQREDFIIHLETQGHPSLWLGHESQGLELLSFFDSRCLKPLQTGRAKLLIYSGGEGCDGYHMNYVATNLHSQLMKYGISPKNVWYATSDLNFKKSYEDWWENLQKEEPFTFGLYNDPIHISAKPFYWDKVKANYREERDTKGKHQTLDDLQLKERPLKYLCLNKAPREHRFSLAMYLWAKHYDEGYLSMSDWDHDLQLFWSHWTTVFPEDSKYMDYLKTKADDFKEALPLRVDCSYQIGTDQSCVNWENQAWTYTDTWFSICGETSFLDNSCGEVIFPTEKTFKLFANMHPFILLANPGTMKAFKEMGFKTFSPAFDESYDEVVDVQERMDLIMNEIDRLMALSQEEWAELYEEHFVEILEHNYYHFWENGNNVRDLLGEMLED